MDINSVPESLAYQFLNCATVDEAIDLALAAGFTEDEIIAFMEEAQEGDEIDSMCGCDNKTGSEEDGKAFLEKEKNNYNHRCPSCDYHQLDPKGTSYGNGSYTVIFKCCYCYKQFEETYHVSDGSITWTEM